MFTDLLLYVVLTSIIIDNRVSCSPKPGVVETPSGEVTGIETFAPRTNAVVYQYRRIPFAKPPVGSLRFQKPVPFGRWEGILDGRKFGPACMQNVSFLGKEYQYEEYSEDCLYLNVYVPIATNEKRLSVMVWIHGGAFYFGSALSYNAVSLAATENVIVVTVNYRVGLFGFLTLNDDIAKGNYGIWDQILALQWIHSNIEAFGGDKNSVTIFGESAGGISVHLQSLIPANRGNFHRVIAQSGSSHLPVALTTMSPVMTQMIGNILNCPYDESQKREFLDCLSQKSAQEIVDASNYLYFQIPEKFAVQMAFGPVIDGELFPDGARTLLSESYPDVLTFYQSLDLMIGTTSSEGSSMLMLPPQFYEKYQVNILEGVPTSFVCDVMAKTITNQFFKGRDDIHNLICQYYEDKSSLEKQTLKAVDLLGDFTITIPAVEVGRVHTSGNPPSNTYFYTFSRSDAVLMYPLLKPAWFKGAAHGDELLYLFGIQDLNVTEEDLQLSLNMMEYWSNFAKYGDPNSRHDDGLPVWPQYKVDTEFSIDLDTTITVTKQRSTEQARLWLDTIPSMLKSGKDEL